MALSMDFTNEPLITDNSDDGKLMRSNYLSRNTEPIDWTVKETSNEARNATDLHHKKVVQ